MAAKILIVDDHPIVREGLAMQIGTQPDLEVCGEAEDVAGALQVMESTQPDVVVVDISLKNSSGIDLIQRIKERYDGAHILVWSMYPENLYAERALRAGAQGYFNKAQPTSQVLEAVRSVLAGRIFISGEATDELLHSVIGDHSTERSPMERLSNRELEAFEFYRPGADDRSDRRKDARQPQDRRNLPRAN